MKFHSPHYWQDRVPHPHHPLLAIVRFYGTTAFRMHYNGNKVKKNFVLTQFLKYCIDALYYIDKT